MIEAPLIQHELGHNLSLHHGGGDEITCKPNYPSVMNYNAPLALSFTYSSGSWLDLNENMLNETVGVNAGLGPVDWNNNSVFDSELIAANINDAVPVNWSNKILNLLRAANLEDILLFGDFLHNCDKSAGEELTELPNPNDWARVEANLGRYLVLPNNSVDMMAGSIAEPEEITEPTIDPNSTVSWRTEGINTSYDAGAQLDTTNPEEFATNLFDLIYR